MDREQIEPTEPTPGPSQEGNDNPLGPPLLRGNDTPPAPLDRGEDVSPAPHAPMVGQASPPDVMMTSGDACPTDFLAALKVVIGGFRIESPEELILSAKDIAERMKKHGWEGYKDKWLQTEIGRMLNKYKLGVYVGRKNNLRVYRFSGMPLNPVAETSGMPLNPVAGIPPATENPVAGIPPATENPVAGIPSATENPVAGIPSATENPMAGIPSATENPVAGIPSATENPVAGIPSATENPVAGIPSASENPLAGTPSASETNGGFDLGKSLEQILEEKRGRIPEMIEHATAEDYEDVVKALTLVEDKVLREEYLKRLSKKLGLPRKLFKDQVREYLEVNKVPYKQPDIEDTGFVDEYNKRFAVLLGGNAGVLNLKQDELVIYNVSEFVYLITANETEMVCTERGTMRETTKGSLWLKHPRRREYQGIEFLPNGSTNGFYNLWKGFPVKPDAKAGTFDRFRELVDDLICSGVEYEKQFVWNWMASLLQFPERKQGTAIAIRGLKGTGKTCFGEVLRMLLGQYYVLADKEEHVSGRFNAHLARCLLVHCDEAFFTGNQKAAGTVKSLITSATNTIERKNKDPISVRNYTRVLITSEKDRICSADEGERRYAVFEISQKRQNDIEFFGGLFDELQAGGLQALMAYLLSLKVEDRMSIPRTKALMQQQEYNLDAIQSYLVYLCSHAILPDLERYWNTKNQATEERITTVEWTEKEGVVIRKDALYQHFIQITPKNQYMPMASQFFLRINGMLEGDIKQSRPRPRDRRYCYRMPPREYMLCCLSEKFGISFDDIETMPDDDLGTAPTA